MTTTSAIVPFNPQEAVQLAISMKQVVIAMSADVLTESVDFGKIPGTDKNVLLKPGAERLCSAFKLAPLFEAVSQVEDFDRGFFFYRYSCTLIHRETGEVYGRGIGSCNSQENKYGWRWTTTPPSHLDKSTLMTRSNTIQELKFAIDKPTTTGKYGKPQEYWDMWKQGIADGTAHRVPNDKARKNGKGEVMETWEMGGLEYRIPNPDVFDLVNTIDKMAQKRALIAATLIATNASEFFTQDMEDFAPELPRITIAPQIVVEGQFEEIPAKAAPAPVVMAPAPTPRPAMAPSPAAPVIAPAAQSSGVDSGHWSDDPKMVSACHKWVADTFGATSESIEAVLSENGMTLKDLTRGEFKGLMLASSSSFDAEIIAKMGEAKGLPADVISCAMMFVRTEEAAAKDTFADITGEPDTLAS